MASESNQNDFVHTNVRVFYEVAQASYEIMRKELDLHRKPKPNGEPGWIITWNPDHKCFKKALVTIVFCGVWLESILHLLIVKNKGIESFKKNDRKTYGHKLKLLGCSDDSILKLCERLRKARIEIVHEKAYLDNKSLLAAQTEAESAIELVNKVVVFFKLKFD